MQKINVKENEDGKRLTTFLTSKYPELKIGTVRKTIRKRDIKINGKRISQDTVVRNGDVIEVYISDALLHGNRAAIQVKAVYEDENIVVFNKPAGLEVEGENSLTEMVKQEYDFIKPCHRIDRNTIGLVLYAKNPETLKVMEEKFRLGEIEKHYIACCYGKAKVKEDLTAYLFKDRKKALVYISEEPKKGYAEIKTSYKLLDANKEKKLALLDVTLHTGKTHQIRAHLAHVGLPIIGDGKYGSYEINKRFKQNRQLLCSYSIAFRNMKEKLKYLEGKTIKLKEIPFQSILTGEQNV